MPVFLCCFCTHTTQSFSTHLTHREVHTVRLSEKYHCGFDGCKYYYNSVPSLKKHIRRSHNLKLGIEKRVLPAVAVDRRGQYVCSVSWCQEEQGKYADLSRHLGEHINSGTEIKCPFQNCEKKYSVLQSWRSHVSRKHRYCIMQQPVELVSDGVVEQGTNAGGDQMDVEGNVDVGIDEDLRYEHEAGNQNNSDIGPSVESIYLTNVALLFLEMEVKLKIPVSSIDRVAKQINSLQSIQTQHVEQILGEFLLSHTTPELMQEALELLRKHNLFANNYSQLSSPHLRKQYYKKHLNYVPPKNVKLQNGKVFHRISVKDTIKAVIKSTHDLPVKSSDPLILRDIKDGTVYKTNPLFSCDNPSVELIFFSDAFNVVNPLGSAKKMHKMIGIYCTFGNMNCQDRSHLDNIYLIALCNENLYNEDRDAIWRPIIKEIKSLENEGVCLDSGERLNGSIHCICGDNLGSHGLCSLPENFSTSDFFCRFCLISRKEFKQNPETVKFCPKRDKRSYEKSVNALNENGESFGVKSDCIFNELNYFHVCAPGLPPCLAHDLFEGIVKFDLAMYIRCLIEQRHWLLYSKLNSKICKFTYTCEDVKGKPKPLDFRPKVISGSASEVWCFLRLLPLIISDSIKDPQDPVWKTVLLLQQIVDIVCSPVIHRSFLPYLELLISQYIENRVLLFPNVPLRPKHHYVTHYPEMISAFGPLVHVWTLRFESKHSYFKSVLRASKNFINVTQHCAEKHQLLMAYNLTMSRGSRESGQIIMKKERDFDDRLWCDEIKYAIDNANVKKNDCLFDCEGVTYKGKVYEKGCHLAVEQLYSEYNLKLGVVRIIITDGCENCFFVIEKIHATFVPTLRAYMLGIYEGYVCVNVKDLPQFDPVRVYEVGDRTYGKLQHAIVNGPIA